MQSMPGTRPQRLLDLPIMVLPRMVAVEQHFSRQQVSDIPREVTAALDSAGVAGKLRPGMRVAITAGSRGIRNIGTIVRAAADYLKAHQCLPFVVGAMGSHGGGTAAGQAELLAELGVTEASVGCPVLCSDDTVEVGEAEVPGCLLYCDANAFHADGILVLNRIKPHTSFRGDVESGLSKMLTVGLGKVPGATNVHRLGFAQMHRTVPAMAKLALERLPVLAGLAILENAYDETARFAAIPANLQTWRQDEAQLLDEARANMPSLPAGNLDLLIIDEIGKMYSGTGADTNIVGRNRQADLPDPDFPNPKRIYIRDLADASHGNGNGVGIGDATHQRLYAKFDRRASYLNAVTSGNVNKVFLPMIFDSDYEAITAMIASLKLSDPRRARIMHIPNTLHIDHLLVSEALVSDLRPQARPVGEPRELAFDAAGDLVGQT